MAFAILRPAFISGGNINDMLRSWAIAALMFLGLTWILVAVEIDVSFMPVAALSNMIAAGFVAAEDGWGLAALAGVQPGCVAGGGSFLGPALSGDMVFP